MLPEFSDPEYNFEDEAPLNVHDRERNLTDAGLTYLLKAKSYVGKRLSELKDAFFHEGDKSKLVSDLAGDMHKLLDQAESFEVQLRHANLSIIRSVLEMELAQRGFDKILRAGHSLTGLAEKCALDVLHYLNEFDPRKTTKEYCQFLTKKVGETLHCLFPTKSHLAEDKISWPKFEQSCLESRDYEARSKYLMPLLSQLPLTQLKILTGLYGLDGCSPKSEQELSDELELSAHKLMRLKRLALTRLGIAIDPNGFREAYYSGLGTRELIAQNRPLWEHMKQNGLLENPQRNYKGNPYQYYLEHYAGVTRGRLSRLDHRLHEALRNHGQLHLVPIDMRNFSGNPKDYYLNNYPGIPRTELHRLDPSLYESLRYHKQLDIVPTMRDLVGR